MWEIFGAYFAKGEQWRTILRTFAIKHQNITLFDYLVLKRVVNREDILHFEKVYSSPHKHEEIKMLFINLINANIKYIEESVRKAEKKKDEENKKLLENMLPLFWVPPSLTAEIYEYLIENHTKIGIVFGMMHKMRAKVAIDLVNKAKIF
jgi:hypothetical protein